MQQCIKMEGLQVVVPETCAGSTWHFVVATPAALCAFLGRKGVYSPCTGTPTSLHTPILSVTELEVSPLELLPPAPSPWLCA